MYSEASHIRTPLFQVIHLSGNQSYYIYGKGLIYPDIRLSGQLAVCMETRVRISEGQLYSSTMKSMMLKDVPL